MTLIYDFPQVNTHDQILDLVRDFVAQNAAGATWRVWQKKDPIRPGYGTIYIDFGLQSQGIPYGLPDSREAILQMAATALEDSSHWKTAQAARGA